MLSLRVKRTFFLFYYNGRRVGGVGGKGVEGYSWVQFPFEWRLHLYAAHSAGVSITPKLGFAASTGAGAHPRRCAQAETSARQSDVGVAACLIRRSANVTKMYLCRKEIDSEIQRCYCV